MDSFLSRLLLRPVLLIIILFLALDAFAARAAQCESRNKASSASPVLASAEGQASYFGKGLEGELTASGEPFDPDELVAAHPDYPLGTVARVVNLDNGCAVVVRIIDRGPAQPAQQNGVIIDLSQTAARALSFVKDGKAPVRVEVLKWGKDKKPPI